MNKLFISITLLFSLNAAVCSQSFQEQNKFSSTFSNLWGGLLESAEWYDIPIGAAYFTRKFYDKSPLHNSIYIPASTFEKKISGSVGVNNRESFGSFDQDYYPNLFFGGRLLAAVGLGLFTDTKISKNTFRDIFLFKKAIVYTYTLTEYTKTIVKRQRPDESDTRSFFSGHTSTTFATSTYLFLEVNNLLNEWNVTKNDQTLRSVLKFSSFGLLYGWAGYVGYSRMLDNKHYVTDVLIGATVGTLMSIFVYNIYHEKDKEETLLDNFSLLPSRNNALNLSFNLKF
ncbi:MAG: phosphatase PAP2 family protein [Ignavibacteriae bacterium]|nr:phosphatase PAP2 family protein [Ignavibacteriota bacterium]NOG97197.1 phosphatase PAP2 family protein [Ignavibacteriota bacterium]